MSNDQKQVTYEEFEQALVAEEVTPSQAAKAWERLGTVPVSQPRSGLPAILSYLGAFGALFAMGAGMVQIYDHYQAGGALVLALAYYGIFSGIAGWMAGRGNRVASGLLHVLAVTMTPFVVGSLLDLMHQRANADQAVLITALSTVAVGLLYTYWTRISFVIVPSLLAGAWAALALGNLVGGPDWLFNNSDWALTLYGVFVVIVTTMFDGRTKEDYAAWGYGIGAAAFWAGLSIMTKNEAGYALYAAAGVVSALVVSVALSRRVFAITGGFAIVWYVGHLVDHFFRGSDLFPFVLAAFFVGVIVLAELYRRNVTAIEQGMLRFLGKAPKSDNGEK